MKLCLSQIKEITLGAVRFEETNDGIFFYRFTKEQEEAYKELRLDFHYKGTFATSGIKFRFKTDSKKLFLKALAVNAGVRGYYSIEVFVNGKRIDDINNFSDVVGKIDNYTNVEYQHGECSKSFDLGEGIKDVCVYLPWSVNTILKSFELDDNSFVEPVKPSKNLLCFGDSITHGVDALYPSNKYASQLADLLDAQEYNKAVSGDRFFPELAKLKDDLEPDYITIAYGTNDWFHSTRKEFEENCRKFYSNIIENYPNAKIVGITPIWRKDMNDEHAFGKFSEIADVISEQTKDFKNVTIINGFNLVPREEQYFADKRLHPNDMGFKLYFKSLISKGIFEK